MPWEPNLIPFQDLEDAAIANLERVHYGDPIIFSMSGGTVNNLLEISDIFDNSKVNQTINLSSIITSSQQCKLTPHKLSRRWSISETFASKTLKVTTQKGLCSTMFPVESGYGQGRHNYVIPSSVGGTKDSTPTPFSQAFLLLICPNVASYFPTIFVLA